MELNLSLSLSFLSSHHPISIRYSLGSLPPLVASPTQDRAFVAAEKYKEGKFILEKNLMVDVSWNHPNQSIEKNLGSFHVESSSNGGREERDSKPFSRNKSLERTFFLSAFSSSPFFYPNLTKLFRSWSPTLAMDINFKLGISSSSILSESIQVSNFILNQVALMVYQSYLVSDGFSSRLWYWGRREKFTIWRDKSLKFICDSTDFHSSFKFSIIMQCWKKSSSYSTPLQKLETGKLGSSQK